MKIGIISDTHGLLRPEVLTILKECDAILHGGDINRQSILDELERIAPVYVVRGNNDKEWAEGIPAYLDFDLSGLRIYMTHKKKDLPKDLSGYDLVVYGHSHKYEEASVGDTLLLNPGSCGPRRFHQAITMAIADVCGKEIHISRIEIAHEEKKDVPQVDMLSAIETVLREYHKGKPQNDIAVKTGMPKETVELIIRLYVTHPGVTAEGIMRKMGL